MPRPKRKLATLEDKQVSSVVASAGSKRVKRGRPSSRAVSSPAKKQAPTTSTATKRPRGRPRIPEHLRKTPLIKPRVKEGRGRPRKSDSEKKVVDQKPKSNGPSARGKAKKSAAAANVDGDGEPASEEA